MCVASIRLEVVDGSSTFAELVVEDAPGYRRLFAVTLQPVRLGVLAPAAERGDDSLAKTRDIAEGHLVRAGWVVRGTWTVEIIRYPPTDGGWCGTVTLATHVTSPAPPS